jgi:AcrR family transcriptional regulator
MVYQDPADARRPNDGTDEGHAERGSADRGDPADGEGTRERILDIALDLFVDKGYEATSLREIAEAMGFSKAALYYHFRSKTDIFLALHLRMHAAMGAALTDLGPGPVSIARWARFLDQLVDGLLAHRKLFLLHERNRGAVDEVHSERHEGEHVEMQERLRAVLTDPAVDPQQRFRMAASFATAFSTVMLAGDVFSQLGTEDTGALVRGVIRDILAPVSATP